jgi:PHD/YefM family antitoxin component YafN of YafNO toxin-antitoxin module
MLTSYSSKEARQQWRKILDKILLKQGDVLIKRNNQPVAVIIPATDYLLVQHELESQREAQEAQTLYEAWQRGEEESISLAELSDMLGIE